MMETILYVEDDLSLIDGLEYTLETNGYSVDNARTVKQALALFNSKSYKCRRAAVFCRSLRHFLYIRAAHAVRMLLWLLFNFSKF